MFHRLVEIKLQESPAFSQNTENHQYNVSSSSGKMVFSAHCKYGTTFAVSPQDAVDGCKALIDRAIQS